jgi:hypothetical protein
MSLPCANHTEKATNGKYEGSSGFSTPKDRRNFIFMPVRMIRQWIPASAGMTH